MRRGISCGILLVAGVLASGPASSRTLVMLGTGFGIAPQDYGPPGSLGVTAGVLHPLPHGHTAVGLEVAYQMLGRAGHDCDRSQSVIPITLQLYEPVGITAHRLVYVTAGGGVYVRRWGMPSGCYYLAQHSHPYVRYATDETATAGGFNIGLGAKSRAPRGEPAFGADLRYHGMYPRGYASLWTAGIRMFF